MQSRLHAPGEATRVLAQLDVQVKRNKAKGKHSREAQQLVHLAENIGALLHTLIFLRPPCQPVRMNRIKYMPLRCARPCQRRNVTPACQNGLVAY